MISALLVLTVAVTFGDTPTPDDLEFFEKEGSPDPRRAVPIVPR